MKSEYGTTRTNHALSKALNDKVYYAASFRRDGAVLKAFDYIEKSPAPAWYDVTTGDVYIDLPKIKVPAGSDWVTLSESEREVLIGVAIHELAHSRWTNWLREKIDPRVRSTLLLFEEGRIERNAINVTGEYSIKQLRAAFSAILLPAFIEQLSDGTMTPYAVASAYALGAGRVIAGHVTSDEITDLELAVRSSIGDDIVDELDEVLQQALMCSTGKVDHVGHGFNEYMRFAQRWNDILIDEFGEPGSARGVPSLEAEGEGFESSASAEATEDSESGDGETTSDGSGDGSDEEKDGSEGETGVAGEDENDGDEDETGEGESPDSPDEDEDENEYLGNMGQRGSVDPDEKFGAGGNDKWLSDMDAEKVLKHALEMLAKETGEPLPDTTGKPSSASEFAHVFTEKGAKHHWKERPPTPQERAAATLLTRLFEEMSTPAIVKKRAASTLPPGKLRSGEAVRRAADRSAGRMSQARPWSVERRKHDTAPPITVGIATDTSGSMKWAEDLVASTAWIFASAGHRIGAKVAAVTFGNEAEAVVRPKELPKTVRTRKANGALEAFDDALAALDSALHLTDGRPGRKVLVIVSDGHLVRHGEDAKRHAWLTTLAKAGVDVIWANTGNISYLQRMLEGEVPADRVVQIEAGDHNKLVQTIVRALNK